MTKTQIIAMAVAYTLIMAALAQFNILPTPAGIIIAVANVWFWMGRLSCHPHVGTAIDVVAPSKPKWGRG